MLAAVLTAHLPLWLVADEDDPLLVPLGPAQPGDEVLQRAHLGLGLQDLARVQILQHPVASDAHNLDAE